MMNFNLNNDNGVVDDSFFIINQIGKRPNTIVIDDLFDGYEFEKSLKDWSQSSSDENNSLGSDDVYISEVTPHGEHSIINQKVFKCLIKDHVWISYLSINQETDDFICNNVVVYYYDFDISFIETLKTSILGSILPLDDEDEVVNKLFTINLGMDGLEIDPVSCESVDDWERFYHKDTIKSIKNWIKKSKKNKSGISFFYGEKGRGKTTFLKHLSEKLDRIILYIPTNYLDQTFNNPDFKNFIKNNKYLLVIDDAEVSCVYPNNILINNIHQLVDGILSDSIDVQILLIYNSDLPTTILNVNNIISKIEFKKITVDQATSLNTKKKFTRDVNLVEVFKEEKESRKKISL